MKYRQTSLLYPFRIKAGVKFESLGYISSSEVEISTPEYKTIWTFLLFVMEAKKSLLSPLSKLMNKMFFNVLP